jgi:hypothetical protein
VNEYIDHLGKSSCIAMEKIVDCRVPAEFETACDVCMLGCFVEGNVVVRGPSVVEFSHLHGSSSISSGCVVCDVDLAEGLHIPEHLIVVCFPLRHNSFCCVAFSVHDDL